MRVLLLTLVVSLFAGWGIAEETVILSDGSRMQVQTFEVRGNVAVIKTLEGELQSLPLTYIDIEATEALVSHAPVAVVLPTGREARVRWALEHYGGRDLLDAFVGSIIEVVAADPGTIPEAVRDELVLSFTSGFDREAIFGEVTQSFLSDTDGEAVGHWARWLESPVAVRAMALESVGEHRTRTDGVDFLSEVAGASIPARRRALLVRLEDAAMILDTLYEMYSEAMSGMVTGVQDNTTSAIGTIFGSMANTLPELTPEIKDAFVAYFHYVYASLGDSELDSYVRFWESPTGRTLAEARRRASVAGFRNAGVRTGVALAAVYTEYLRAVLADVDNVNTVEEPDVEPQSFTEMNFEFTPPHKWATFDASSFAETAQVGYLRNAPVVAFIITAEDLGSTDMTSEQAASLARANLESSTSRYELLSQKPYVLSGMDGVLLASEAETGNLDLYYMQWVYFHNGYFYQLAAWGEKKSHDLASLEKHAREVFSGFRLLDPERSARPMVAVDLLTDIRSEEHGFSLALAGTGWSNWGDVEESVPEAVLGGLYGESAGFVVIPVYLGELTPSADALSRALLSQLGIEWSAVPAAKRRSISESGREGYDIDFERQVNETDYVYRIHVSRSESAGYMLASWVRRGEDPAILEEVLARFELTPASPFGENSVVQGTILNEMGLAYYEQAQYAQSAPFFRAASRTSPTDPVLLENLVSALSRTERYDEGLRRLDECGDRFLETVSLQSYRPFFLGKLGRYDEAADGYHALFANGYQNDSDLWDYTDVLWELGRGEDAVDVVATYRQDRDSVTATRLHALLLRRTDRHDQAIALLESRSRSHPTDIGLAGALLDAQYEAERYESSLELARKLIDRGMAPEGIHFRKGRSELALGRMDDAKASFEAALDANPSDSESREYLDYVTSQLGQGEHDSIRRTLEAVVVPENILAPAVPSSEQTFEDFGVYYANRVRAIAFRANEEYRHTDRYVIHITDQKAVSSFSSFAFDFSPRHERIFVNELRVTDEDGKTVSTGDVSTYYVTDDTSDDVATSDKLLNIPIAALEPGHTLHLTVTRQYTSPPETMPFIRHMFSLGYPTLKSSLYVSGTVEQLRHRAANLAPAVVAGEGISWTIEKPPIYRAESLSDSPERYLPFVWIGDRTENWETLAREYLEQIEDRLELDNETRALAQSLVEGAATSEARFAALAEFVQDNVTYKAIEFGRRARVPNFTMEIVGNRYGDCKDHSLLFYQLLRAVDEPAELVLVSTNKEVQTEVASLDQFNHMVVYSSAHRGGHFFDLTDKNHDVVSLPPMGLAGAEVLVLDPAAPRIVRLPEYPDDSNRLVSRRKLHVEGSRDLVVEETLALHGYYAAWLRSALKSNDSATQKRQIQSYMRAEANAVVQSVSTENLGEQRQPLVLHVRYRLPGALYEADRTLVGKVPAIWERTFLDVAPSEERQTPFRIEYPLRVESEVTVTVPDGYRIASSPKDVATRSARAEWEVTTTQLEPELVLHSLGLRPSGDGSAEEFAEYVSTMSSFLASLEGTFVLERTN